jgi:hypothetical protein
LAAEQLAEKRSLAKQSGLRLLLTPTGVVIVGAALGLLGTAWGKQLDYRTTKLEQQTAVILKASEVSDNLPEEDQKKQRALNLLWFADAGYITLEPKILAQIRTDSGLAKGAAVPSPVIQSSSAALPVAGSTHYNFPVMNASSPDPAGIDVDVFSCGGPQSPGYKAAETFAKSLAQKADAKQVVANEHLGRVRFTSGTEWSHADVTAFDPSERNFAQALAADARRQTNRPMATQANPGSPSPSYVSVFFCGT